MHLIAICFVVWIIYSFRDFLRCFYYTRHIPAPFMGNINFLRQLQPEKLFLAVTDIRRNMKKSFRLVLGTNIWIYIHSPEDARIALNHPNLSRPKHFQLLNILCMEGLLVSKGQKWKSHRKALQPAFSVSMLNSFVNTINAHSNILIDILEEKHELEVTTTLFHCILDIICETSMGAKINSQLAEDKIYAEAFHNCMHLIYRRIVNPLLTFDFIYKRTPNYSKLKKSVDIIHKLTGELVMRRSKFRNLQEKGYSSDEYGKKEKKALLDILFNTEIHGQPFSSSEIIEEVNTFLFAGVDTTTSSLCFILWCLGKHQEHQQRLYDDICTVLVPGDLITSEHIHDIEFLDFFIKECNRLYTVVPLIGREADRDIYIGDLFIPKGTEIWINSYGMANDSEYFVDADVFRPERFYNEDSRSKLSNLPFGGGLRECIGKAYAIQILKILTTNILLHYSIKLQNPHENISLISEMSSKNENGFNLVFEKRK